MNSIVSNNFCLLSSNRENEGEEGRGKRDRTKGEGEEHVGWLFGAAGETDMRTKREERDNEERERERERDNEERQTKRETDRESFFSWTTSLPRVSSVPVSLYYL